MRRRGNVGHTLRGKCTKHGKTFLNVCTAVIDSRKDMRVEIEDHPFDAAEPLRSSLSAGSLR